MTKPMTAKTHGFLDYAVGLLLLASPWLFGFNLLSTTATLTMVVIAATVLLVSLCTDYQWGALKAIPFRVHGILETVGAVVLLISPWLLGFADLAVARNLAVIIAIAYFGVIALTNYNVAYDTEDRITGRG